MTFSIEQRTDTKGRRVWAVIKDGHPIFSSEHRTECAKFLSLIETHIYRRAA